MKRIALSLIFVGLIGIAFCYGVNRGRKVPFNTPVSFDVLKSPPMAEKPAVSKESLVANPLVLSMPVSSGKMELTFASWKDYEVAKSKAGL